MFAVGVAILKPDSLFQITPLSIVSVVKVFQFSPRGENKAKGKFQVQVQNCKVKLYGKQKEHRHETVCSSLITNTGGGGTSEL